MVDIKIRGGIRVMGQILDYVLESKSLKVTLIYHELVRTSQALDDDIKFVLEFLENTELAEIKDGLVNIKTKFNSDELSIKLKLYYLSLLYGDQETRKALFEDSLVFIQDDFLFIDADSIQIKFRIHIKYLVALEVAELVDKRLKIINYSLVKEITSRVKRRVSLEEFKLIQEQKNIKGEIAEKYIYSLEYEALQNSIYKPVLMSMINVGAGYDILSYDESGSKKHIEVKALTSSREFYLSANEVNISKLLGKKYHLTLVSISNAGACHIVENIIDPAKIIFNSERFEAKLVNDYKIKLLK